jgi:hypothetical protein
MTGRLLAVLVIALVIDVFALIDLRYIDRSRIRAFSKPVWAIIIIVVPVIGALLWFLLGRGRKAAPVVRPMAPDDDPEFLRRLRDDSEQQERIRRMEQELSDLDDDQPER